MVNPELLASVDELDVDELDELIEYPASKRFGEFVVTEAISVPSFARAAMTPILPTG